MSSDVDHFEEISRRGNGKTTGYWGIRGARLPSALAQGVKKTNHSISIFQVNAVEQLLSSLQAF